MSIKETVDSISDRVLGKKAGRTLDDALKEVSADLLTIEELNTLSNMPAWIKLLSVLRGQINDLQIKINALARSPQKNADELMELSSLRAAIQGLIDVFETTLDAEAALRERKQCLVDKYNLAQEQPGFAMQKI